MSDPDRPHGHDEPTPGAGDHGQVPPADVSGAGSAGSPHAGPRTAPPAPSAQQAPLRRLVRYPTRAPLAGVSEGLGVYFDIDPLVFRLIWVAAAIFAFPFGIIAYLIAWLAIPRADTEPPSSSASPQRTRTWLAVTLVVIGGLWLVSALATAPVGSVLGIGPLGDVLTSGVILSLLLVGGGIALLVLDRRDQDEPTVGPGAASTPGAAFGPPPQPTSEAPAPSAGGDPTAATTASRPVEGAAPVAPSGSPAGPAPRSAPPAYEPPGYGPPAYGPPPAYEPPTTSAGAPPPQPDPRPRSALGRLTLGGALIALGAAWLLDQTGVVAIGAVQMLSLLLVVLGVGLLVGAWWGRSRGLIVWGIVVAVLLAGAAAVQVGLRGTPIVVGGGIGERTWAPGSVEVINDRYELMMGEATLDLSGVEFDGEQVATTAQLGMGQLTVIVPDDVDVEVDGEVAMGELRLLDHPPAGGIRQVQQGVVDTVDDPAGELQLSTLVGMGELVVERE